jgi:hypothetical protein
VAAALVSSAALPLGSARAAQVTYSSFDAIGSVVSADASTGTLVLSVQSGSDGAQAAKAPDGTIKVQTQPTTKYYRLDTSSGQYANATFAQVMVVNSTIEVAGRYGNGASAYELLANYAWSPPPSSIAPGAVNPQPSTLQDRTPQQSFSAVGSVSQTGVPLTGTLLWSSLWGFVINTAGGNTGSDPRMARIAAAHHNQLPITVDETTKYYDAAGAASSRAAVVRSGAVLFVGGHYMWNGTDWLLLASYVFPPRNTPSVGSMAFGVTANRTKDGQPGSTGGFQGAQYDGQISTGDGQLNPGTISISNVRWEFDNQRAKWVFSATWQGTHLSDHAGVGGTMSGSWSSLPSTGGLIADVVVDPAFDTGYYKGLIGGGTFSGRGTAESDPTKPPVSAITGNFALRVRRS